METTHGKQVRLRDGNAVTADSDSRSDQRNDTKSTANELLSITDAAVKSLDNSAASKPGSKLRKKPQTSVPQHGLLLFRLLSPRINPDHQHQNGKFHHSEATSHDDIFKSKDGFLDLSQESSVGSKSTTGSDILIRSTFVEGDSHDPDNHNISAASRNSSSSRASSAFLTGQAKPVKVSAKRLKQIKSPFSENDGTHPEDLAKETSFPSVGNSSQHSVVSLPSVLGNAAVRRDQAVDNHIGNDGEDRIPVQMTMKAKEISEMSDISFGSNDGQHPQSHSRNLGASKSAPVRTMADSGYMTQNVQVIREAWRGTGSSEGATTSRGQISMTEEMDMPLTADGTHSPVDILNLLANDAQSQNDSSGSQPEILTVPETIVTVKATDVNRQEGQDSSLLSCDTVPATKVMPNQPTDYDRVHRFEMYRPTLLTQGQLTSEPGALGDPPKPKEMLHMANFSLNNKEKRLKDVFVRRNQSNTAVKKVVAPRLVQPDAHHHGNQPQVKSQAADVTEAATTAAVAAASAVAATQPFLKVQQDMEQKMTQLFDRLAARPDASSSDAAGSGSAQHRISDLEKQLGDLTQSRLDYLEAMQRQQLDWQAQLFAVSRQPPANYSKVSPPGGQTKSSRMQHDKSYVRYNEDKDYKKYREVEREKLNVLDTPAPRRKPPTPVCFEGPASSEVKGQVDLTTPERKPAKGGGGLLAQILADAGDTPLKSPFPDTPESGHTSARRSGSPGSLSAVRRAGDLVQDLGGLREHMKSAIHSASQWKAELPRDDLDSAPPSQAQKPKTGPAPLDHYLAKGVDDHPPSSPYPNLQDGRRRAPVMRAQDLAEAEATLRRVHLSRTYLDSNLDAIVKARQDCEVYSLIDMITRDSTQADKLRIKKMVDTHIKSMNSDLQKEVLEELLKVEESKKMTHFMIPEKDTSGVKARSQVKVKGKAEARIDTGLKKGKRDTESKKAAATEKENIPQKRAKKSSKPGKLVENEAYLNRVYGKARHQTQRQTQKEPYLRFQSAAAAARKPLTRPEEVQGIAVATAKTQTPGAKVTAGGQQFYFDPTRGQHIPIQQAAAMPGPVEGHLVAMAVPLGKPRQEGGLPAPVSLASPSNMVTSTPLQQPNIGMVTVREDSEERPARDGVVMQNHKPQLRKQVLPSVDIDSFRSSPERSPTVEEAVTSKERPKLASSAELVEASQSADRKLQRVVSLVESSKYVRASDEEETDEEESIDRSAVIALPGYDAPPARYHGPAFPPPAPPLVREETSSEVLAADMKRRDLMQNKAMDWVEQELMARIISEMYSKRQQETLPHTPLAARGRHQAGEEDEDEVTETEDSQVSGEESFMADAVGQDGLQLFIDSGRPVDEKLVDALVKEVILEKISGTLGQRTSKDDEDMKHAALAPKAKPRTSPRHHVATALEETSEIPYTPVATPEPTPKHSPIHSPVHHVSPPQTPDRTPAASVSEAPAVVFEDEASGATEPVDLEKDEREEDLDLESRHDVVTPAATPPATPPAPRTPSPSLREPTPQPSVQEELKPEVVAPTPLAEPSPSSSPEPSGEPEEDPHFEESVHTPTKPAESPPARDDEDRRLSASSDDSSVVGTVSVSETANEMISEGQWLVSVHSEGEVPSMNFEDDLRERIKQHMMSGGHGGYPLEPGQSHVDDTLLGTDELDPDKDGAEGAGGASEGEFVHRAGVMPDPAPLMSLLSQLRRSQQQALLHPVPISLPLHPTTTTAAAAAALATRVDKSIGEVIYDHRDLRNGAAPTGHALPGQAASGSSTARPALVRRQSSDYASPGELSEGPAFVESGRPAANQPSYQYQAPPSSEEPQGTHLVTVRPASPTQASPQPSQPQGLRGTGTTPGRAHPTLGQVMATDVSMGRGQPPRRYRPGMANGTKPRVIQVGRSDSPEPPKDTPGGATDDRPSMDTAASHNSLGGTSDLDTRTMTPDQMNLADLMQSRDYFTGTQSDLGSTAGQSGRLRQSADLGDSGGRFQGLGSGSGLGLSLGQTMGSTSDMSLSPGLTQTLERSSEEVRHTGRPTSTDTQHDVVVVAGPDSPGGATGDLGLTETLGGSTLPSGDQRQELSHREPRQVSVTLPIMGEEDSESEDDEVSEFSFK